MVEIRLRTLFLTIRISLYRALLSRKSILRLRSLFVLRLRLFSDFLELTHINIMLAQTIVFRFIFDNFDSGIASSIEGFWELPNLLLYEFFEHLKFFCWCFLATTSQTATCTVFGWQIFRIFQLLPQFQIFFIQLLVNFSPTLIRLG